jgi:integrase
MKGHIRRRGENSFELKYDAGADPRTGARRTKYVSFKGSKREAQVKLAELIAAVGSGTHIDASKVTISEFLDGRIDQWESSGKISTRTAERYREFANYQIAPHIGAIVLQKLTALDIEQWHTTLLTKGRIRQKWKGGVAPRTVRHAHRLLSEALDDAVGSVIARNVLKEKKARPPRVPDVEKVIVKDVAGFMEKIKTRDRYYVPTMVSLFTGMRLGEVLALRWGRVDLDGKVIKVCENLEYTQKHGIRFKSPKTKAGRREITLPDILVDVLRDYRKAQLELRMRLGTGKLQADDLLFADINGGPLHPHHFGTRWAECAVSLGFPGVSFHALRHTHASHLIDQGVDIVTISKRLGHSKPDITLRSYAHLFRKDDGKAAAAINAVFKSA